MRAPGLPENNAELRSLYYRWTIIALLFVATVLNYVDRQSLSILATTIQQAFHAGDVAYGNVVTAFLFAYTLAYALTGRITDLIGTRRGLALFILWWSLAEMLPPFIHGAWGLGISRFLLGLGEAGIWVAAPKIVGELFPSRSRALAIGIYTAGATLGATIAPPLITAITQRSGWPMVFVASGFAGLLWLVPWLILSRVVPMSSASRSQSSQSTAQWFNLLANRNLWILLIARFLTDPVWYFYLFWYPKYLEDIRHASFTWVGHIVWVVYLAADIGTILGGIASWYLLKQGRQPIRMRKLLMRIAACAFPLSPAVVLLPSITGALGIAAFLALAHMVWLVTLTALIVDIFPAEQVASAAGWIAAGSGLGGILFTEVVSHSVMAFGYLPVFCLMGVLHPLAFFLVSKLRTPDSSNKRNIFVLRRATA